MSGEGTHHLPARPSGSSVTEEGHQSDADSEREDESTGEGREAKVASCGTKPSQTEIDNHYVLHIPYRVWCPHCVKGKGVNTGHHKKKGLGDEEYVISIDYAYLGETEGQAKERYERESLGNYEDKGRGSPMLVMFDRRSKSVGAAIIRQKGLDPYAINVFGTDYDYKTELKSTLKTYTYCVYD